MWDARVPIYTVLGMPAAQAEDARVPVYAILGMPAAQAEDARVPLHTILGSSQRCMRASVRMTWHAKESGDPVIKKVM